MIRFNIIGTGFVDIEDGSGLQFKVENQWYRFADITLGRSVEFSVPATMRNRKLLGFGDDPSVHGDMLRKALDCQMVYDGGKVDGTLNVTDFDGMAFKCIFLFGNAPWIEALQGKKLSELPCTLKAVTWGTDATVTDANQADPDAGIQILRYDNGITMPSTRWQLVPSVNVSAFIQNIVANLGIPGWADALPTSLWMVAGSMKGGSADSVTFASTATNAATVTQSQQYFSVVDITLEWATAYVFGAFLGGGSVPAKGFKALQHVKVTFPSSMPSGLFLIQWDSRLGRCKTLAGEDANGFSGNTGHTVPKLQGATVEVPKDGIVFFANTYAPDISPGGDMFGWTRTAAPYTYATTVDRGGDIQLGETWRIQDNMPDMTFFEFLKSVALATGLELQVGRNGIRMTEPRYGHDVLPGVDTFKALERVVSIDGVSRRVSCWGDGTVKARVVFDSEDYVETPIVTDYDIPNALLSDTVDFKSSFSEGDAGANGILIRDVDSTSSPYKFAGKKWTLAVADQGSANLQRIEPPFIMAYGDIAANSTCVKVKVLSDARFFFQITDFSSDLFGITPGVCFLLRGIAYVWTEATWGGGIMSLTLQKVSQPRY